LHSGKSFETECLGKTDDCRLADAYNPGESGGGQEKDLIVMVHDVLDDPLLGSGKAEFLFQDEGMKRHVINPTYYFIEGYISSLECFVLYKEQECQEKYELIFIHDNKMIAVKGISWRMRVRFVMSCRMVFLRTSSADKLLEMDFPRRMNVDRRLFRLPLRYCCMPGYPLKPKV
jgi:hypothetical protein